jgi:hypothetical protein
MIGLGFPLCSLLVGMELVHRPTSIRMLFLALIVGVLFVLSTFDPRSAIVWVFALLPFLGIGRRMLISFAGWPAHDPLVLLGPAFVAVLIVRLFVLERRPLVGDRLSQIVLALFALSFCESLNPAGGGLGAGAGGFLYVGVPMLWYFVGRDLVDARTVLRILWVTVALGCLVALYGLYQGLYGFPGWDKAWIAIVMPGQNSLQVGDRVRAFGTFPSSTEYATYLGIGVVVAMALALKGRTVLLMAVPLLTPAIFLVGSRGPVVLVMLALFVVLGLTTGSPRTALVTVVVGVALAGLALNVYSRSLQTQAASSKNDLVVHQVGGLTNPLDSKQSTLLVHYGSVVQGVRDGLHSPLGQGTGSISLGGSQLGGENKSTEFDISNAFVGLGLLGGVLFAWLLLAVGRTASAVYFASRQPVVLAACGVLVVTVGQWLSGSLYAVTPLVWLLIGWLVAQSPARHSKLKNPA